MPKPGRTKPTIFGLVTTVVFVTALFVLTAKYPNLSRRHRSVTVYPPHDFTPATRASTADAAMINRMLELPKRIGLFQSLHVDGKKVIVTVGPNFSTLQEKDLATWVNLALDWGTITTNEVRDVNFVAEDGRLLATYEPVGGVKMVAAATSPASEP